MRKLILIAPFIFSFFGFSQKAEMTVDRDEFRIGEQTTLRILFEYDNPKGDALVGWPRFNDYLTKQVEIIDRTVDYETLIDTNLLRYRREQQLVITAFKPGKFLIPSIEIELNDEVFQTNQLLILVNTVEVDTSKGIVDIYPIYEVDYPFSEKVRDWLKEYWYVLATLAAFFAFLLFRRIWKNRKIEDAEPETQKIPAHLTALSVLNELLSKEQWKQENKKEYYSTLTDTVRLYLEERFGVFAMEQTTKEILSDLKKSDISDNDKAFLQKILHRADMVKFAKFKPNDEDGYNLLTLSIEFVDRTKQNDLNETDEE